MSYLLQWNPAGDYTSSFCVSITSQECLPLKIHYKHGHKNKHRIPVRYLSSRRFLCTSIIIDILITYME